VLFIYRLYIICDSNYIVSRFLGHHDFYGKIDNIKKLEGKFRKAKYDEMVCFKRFVLPS
jgi:hypothetical protein